MNAKEALKTTTSELVPPNLITNYVWKSLPFAALYEHYFELRKRITKQLAVAAAIGYVFGVGQRSLRNIALSVSSGNVLHFMFSPGLTISFVLFRVMNFPRP